MKSNGTVPAPLDSAISQAFVDQRKLVQEFSLIVRRDDIHENCGLWTVPVASGTVTGNAYSLSNALQTLQQQIENLSHLPVSVVFDPTIPDSAKN